QPSAALALPDGFDRVLVIDIARNQVIAELGRGAPARIAVMPGRYGVRAWRGDKVLEGTVAIAAHETHAMRSEELVPAASVSTRAKGSGPRWPIALSLAGGVRSPIADS